MTESEAKIIRETIIAELRPTHDALKTCADGIGQLLSSVEKLVLAVGVLGPDSPSLAMQVRDLRERVGGLETAVGRVEEVAAGARAAADRTHALVLDNVNRLGATDKAQQERLEELGEELNGIAQRESQRAAGVSGT